MDRFPLDPLLAVCLIVTLLTGGLFLASCWSEASLGFSLILDLLLF
jgi:hypothetical protein